MIEKSFLRSSVLVFVFGSIFVAFVLWIGTRPTPEFPKLPRPSAATPMVDESKLFRYIVTLDDGTTIQVKADQQIIRIEPNPSAAETVQRFIEQMEQDDLDTSGAAWQKIPMPGK